MVLNDLMQKKHISGYRLSKESGVPMTTITDICSGKTDLNKCSAGTLYKLSKTLGTTVDFVLDEFNREYVDYRCSFDVFRSNTCHQVKDKGDLEFIIETLNENQIRKFYDRKWYRESMYLLGMVDYLSRVNDLPLCTNYNDIRNQKLEKPLFPSGISLFSSATGDENIKTEAIKNAIPEFMRFNIVESEVRDVC